MTLATTAPSPEPDYPPGAIGALIMRAASRYAALHPEARARLDAIEADEQVITCAR